MACDLIDALPLADVDTGVGVTASRRGTVGRSANTEDDPAAAVIGPGREGAGEGEGRNGGCARLALLGGGDGESDSAATGESNGDIDRDDDGDREGEGEGDGGAPVGLAGLDLGRGALRGARGGGGLIGG